jgi:hypothetical protein
LKLENIKRPYGSYSPYSDKKFGHENHKNNCRKKEGRLNLDISFLKNIDFYYAMVLHASHSRIEIG